VLKSTETKGFGDRILDPKETAFQKSFDCLDAKLNPEKTGLARIIETVLHGKKVNSSQIDGLAGATVTSKALGAMINKSAQELLPIVAANNATLKEGNK
jgi:electron transport complex protein RnfG